MMKLRPPDDSPAVFADLRRLRPGEVDVEYRFGSVLRAGARFDRPLRRRRGGLRDLDT